MRITPNYSCSSAIENCPYNGKFNNACYYFSLNFQEYLEYVSGESPRVLCTNPYYVAIDNWRTEEGL